MGQIDLARHDPAAAVANFTASMQLAEHNDDPYMVAYAQRALGQALRAAGAGATAHHHLGNALARFRRLDLPFEVAVTGQIIADTPAARSAGHA